MPEDPARPRTRVAAAVLGLACLAAPLPGAAQLVIGPSLRAPKDNNRPTEILRTAPSRPNPNALNIWPRLDVGAVFCRTRVDLAMHSRVVAARLDGAPATVTTRPDCVVITAPTPIDIVERAGAGQTEVRIKDQSPRTGWTDAYLPDKQ